jgi:hypothetical protein
MLISAMVLQMPRKEIVKTPPPILVLVGIGGLCTFMIPYNICLFYFLLVAMKILGAPLSALIIAGGVGTLCWVFTIGAITKPHTART